MRPTREVPQQPEVAGAFMVAGFSFGGSSPNRGLIFVNLKPYAERPTEAQSAQALVGRLFGQLMGGIPGAIVIPIVPPSIQGSSIWPPPIALNTSPPGPNW